MTELRAADREDAVDQNSAFQRVSAETVLRALRIPRTGRIYDLGLELNDRIPRNPKFSPLSLTATSISFP